MVLSKPGEFIEVDKKKITVGGRIIVKSSIYEGLNGRILEIKTDLDKETENEDIEIYVQLERPENEEFVQKLERRFSELYREPKKIDDIALDLVILSPEEIEAL